MNSTWLPTMINGTLREHYLLLFGAAGVFALGIGGMSAWIGAYFGARRASRRAVEEVQHESVRLAEERHTLLATSIEAIAIEVERISEAQRFNSRLLSERTHVAPPPLRREPGVVTPH